MCRVHNPGHQGSVHLHLRQQGRPFTDLVSTMKQEDEASDGKVKGGQGWLNQTEAASPPVT